VVRRFEGRAYLDLSSVQATYFDALGALPGDVNEALGGVSAEVNMPAPDPRRERRWRIARVRLLWLMLRHQRAYAHCIDAVQRAARRLPLEFRGYSNAQLIELAERIAEQQAVFGPAFQTGNFAAGAWMALLEQLLERRLPGKGRAVAAGLMAGSGRVTSAEHAARLVELARVADADAAARELLGDADAPDWRALPAGSPFRKAFARFLDEFGHRGVYEAELANPRWIEDPSFLLDQVRTYVRGGLPAPRAGEQRRLAEQALRRLPLVPRVLAMWLARRARRSAALREAGKSALVAMALPVRMLLLEFGRRLVASSLIDTADDVFHLSRADLETFGRGEWDGSDFRALVAERRRVREARLAQPAPPDLIGPAVLPVVSRQLRGLAAAPGVGRGPARLIRHPAEGARLQRGDVLVAPSTDPGWTPLFLRCSAVVTEAGGLLSHGAIVARELGLPAVVNVAGVFGALTDGDEVCVDGNRGIVKRREVR
jgi:pyruvate,water dikinase